MISRILVISTNRECSPQPAVPIGAAWVAEALHRAGFDVKFLDLCFAKEPIKLLGNVVKAFNPDGIAISIRNLDNCDFLSPKSYLWEIRRITDYLKSHSTARILIGGSGASIMPAQLLDYLEIEYALVGEGEKTSVLFFRSQDPDDGCRIPGLVRRGETERSAARVECQTEAAFVMPQMHNWVDVTSYLRYEPVLPLQGKRGCANRCLYCTYNRIEGEKWRLREPAAVVEEMSSAIRIFGAREFEFVDSIFNQPEGYLETLLGEISRRQLKVRLRVSSLSPKGLTREQVRLMEKCGMTSLVITPESASDETLAGLNKDFTEADVNHAAELFSGSRIKALWCFLVGGPNEDENTLARTINFINRKIGKKDGAYITAGIRIYPGTGLHEMAIRDEMIERSDDLLMPTFYFSHGLAPQRGMEMLRKGLAEPARCIFPSDTQSGSLGAFRRMGTMLMLPGPFWRYARYKNLVAGGRRAINQDWSRSEATAR